MKLNSTHWKSTGPCRSALGHARAGLGTRTTALTSMHTSVVVTVIVTMLATTLFMSTFASPALSAESWAQSYGSAGSQADLVARVVLGTNANIYLAGASQDAAGGWNGVLLQYNNAGDPQWIDTFDPSPTEEDIWMDAEPLGYEGVIVCGWVTDAGTAKMATARYDADGTQSWMSTATFAGALWSEGVRTLVFADGSSLTVGLVGRSDDSQDIALVRYDDEGAEAWATTWTSSPGLLHNVAGAVVLPSGGVVVAGSVRSIADATGATSDVYAVQLDPAGAVDWTYSYDSGDGESASKLALSTDGTLAIGGQRGVVDASALVIHLTAAGDEDWVASFGATGNQVELRDIATDSANNVIAVGSNVDEFGNQDYLTLKFSPTGALLWDASLDGPVSGADEAVAVVLDADNQIYVTGTTETLVGSGARSGMTTLQYSATGTENWTELYDFADSTRAEALSMDIDGTGQVFVAGSFFSGIGVPSDIALLAYGGAPAEVDGSVPTILPSHVALGQNFPNPAWGETTVHFALPQSDHVRMSLYDTSGRLLSVAVDEEMAAGYHETTLDVHSLPSGVYFYRMETNDGRRTRKLTLAP